MTATATGLTITEPGIYDGIPDDVYHADPVPGGSLSSTGARKLLPPSCPARFDHERRNPPASTPAFDLGKVAHALVLGVGQPTKVINAPDWRTKAAREERDAAYTAGLVPILEADYQRAVDMADAIRRHPLAAALLHPDRGQAEQSAVWRDPRTGIWRRARFDYLRTNLIVDLKTCETADEEHVRRAIHTYGYHQQAAFYLDALRDLEVSDDPAFVFVFVEKRPPHLVHVVQLDDLALATGDDRNRQAIDTYVNCTTSGVWPGYPWPRRDDDITTVSLPPYALTAQEHLS